jgi:predicted  nucleic acid-binding Zn-ribbon protein
MLTMKQVSRIDWCGKVKAIPGRDAWELNDDKDIFFGAIQRIADSLEDIAYPFRDIRIEHRRTLDQLDRSREYALQKERRVTELNAKVKRLKDQLAKERAKHKPTPKKESDNVVDADQKRG